ncbi:MAG: hypothetical protein ACI35S_02055 [Anaeroplasma sp.]
MIIIINYIFRFIRESRITTIAGALCFFIILNGGSYIFLFVSLGSLIIDPAILINSLLNEGILKDILLYLFNYNSSIPFNIFLFASSVYSSSSLYYHFIQAGEIITDGKIDYKYNKRITSVLLSLLIIFIFLVLSIVITILPLFKVSEYISYLFGLIILILFVYILNKIILKGHSMLKLKYGLIFSVLYVILFSLGYFIYLSIFKNFKIVYGYFSIIIVTLFYLYSILIGVLIGIRINWKILEA